MSTRPEGRRSRRSGGAIGLWCMLLLAVLPHSRGSTAPEGPVHGDQQLIEALRVYIPHAMRLDGTPGLSIALARRGRLIWAEGFGYADLARQVPMTPRTVMRAGSMTKPYTAVAVMQLVERGVVGLDEPVNRYLGKLRLQNPLGAREITVRDLLTHRSGLSPNNASSDFGPPPPLGAHLAQDLPKTHFELYSGTLTPRWSARVGERFQYSNQGIAFLGYLVEVMNPQGLSFSEYVQRHIIDPLGMRSTQLPPGARMGEMRAEVRGAMATGYARFGPVWLPTPEVTFGDYPCGGLVTTPMEHIRLLLAMLNRGEYGGARILEPRTVQEMLSMQVPDVRSGRDLGLVWFLGRQAPDRAAYFGHNGAHMYGWQGTFRAYPAHDFALVVMANRWDMVLWGDQGWKETTALVADFVSDWLASEGKPSARVPGPEPWPWKVSYAIGLVLTEQLKGALGIPSPLDPQRIDAMAAGAQLTASSAKGESLWDERGFRAGVADMLATRMTPASLREFLVSPRNRLTVPEMELIQRELGGRGMLTIPSEAN